MSYSVCDNCGEMVPLYERYCRRCVKKHGLVQDENYWRPKSAHSPAVVSEEEERP